MNVAEIFQTMEYGPAPESKAPAERWLDERGRAFGPFIDGELRAAGADTFESLEPATGRVLARFTQCGAEDIDAAVAAARRAQPGWWALGGHGRARYLYALARQVQKNARLLAVLETLDNGKPIRETRDLDVPLVARHFYYHAGWAQLLERELPGQVPLGVAGQIIPWNFPLLMLAWKIAPALAAGNTVVLKPAELTPVTALAFAELCRQVGLPPGVVNIVTGDGRTGELIVRHSDVDKIAFTGSTEVGRLIRQATAGSGKKLSLELGGKSPFVVFDDADLDGAVEGVVDAIWFNQGEVCCAGSRLLVQEGVAEEVYDKLRDRMERLRLGDPADKAVDLGAIISPVQLDRIRSLVDKGVEEGASMWQPSWSCPREGWFYPPTLFTGVSPASSIAQVEIFGPVLAAMTFRTPDEAVELANNIPYGLAASVWTENVNLALHVASRIVAGTVWINSTNLFDAASGFGGYRESGFGREGGREGMWEYLQPAWEAERKAAAKEAAKESGGAVAALGAGAAGGAGAAAEPGVDGDDGAGAGVAAVQLGATEAGPADDGDGAAAGAGVGEVTAAEDGEDGEDGAAAEGTGGAGATAIPVGLPAIDRTAKMYIGGRQVRPDGNYSRPVHGPGGELVGEVGEGNRKDVREAVEAARKAAPSWGRAAAHLRAQILYYVAENLAARRDETAGRLTAMTGAAASAAGREVDLSLERLFDAAAWADKYAGTVQAVPQRTFTFAVHEPIGTLAIVCPDDWPLLAFVATVAPAVAMGNCVVAVPSPRHPLAATDLYQVFDTSDLPGGVVNIVTGDGDELGEVLAAHDDVDCLWHFGSRQGAERAELASAGNLKRTWCDRGLPRDWADPAQAAGEPFLRHAIQVKNIWTPFGE